MRRAPGVEDSCESCDGFIAIELVRRLLSVQGGSQPAAEEVFRAVPGYRGVHRVRMPPTWKAREPIDFTYVVLAEEPDARGLGDLLRAGVAAGVPNPRPVTTELLEMASLFHPLFYASLTSRRGASPLDEHLRSARAARLRLDVDPALRPGSLAHYLQSLLFLAGCTLSAAIVQDRYSQGTIESKLNRLWQAAQYARRFGFAGLDALRLDEFVLEAAADARTDHERLIAIKKRYSAALRTLQGDYRAERRTLRAEPLRGEEAERLGFVDQLEARLGDNLRGAFVYGSAVTSRTFSDYDVVVIVEDSEAALRALAGASPRHKGKEINVGVYDPAEFETFQTFSGDNLDRNARCIHGEADLVVKPASDLMLRNFSFGFIRLRQLLGMSAYLADHRVHAGLRDHRNLYEYFAKIPMHIMKGVRAVAGEPVDKELINAWTARELGYDAPGQLALVEAGRPDVAMVGAYVATAGVMRHLNARYRVYDVVPREDGDFHRHLEKPAPRSATP